MSQGEKNQRDGPPGKKPPRDEKKPSTNPSSSGSAPSTSQTLTSKTEKLAKDLDDQGSGIQPIYGQQTQKRVAGLLVADAVETDKQGEEQKRLKDSMAQESEQRVHDKMEMTEMKKEARKKELKALETTKKECLTAFNHARANQETFADHEVEKISGMFDHLMAQSRLNYGMMGDLSQKRKDAEQATIVLLEKHKKEADVGGLKLRVVNHRKPVTEGYIAPRAQEQLDNLNANPNHLVIFPKGDYGMWPEQEVWDAFFPRRVFDMLAGQFPPEKADDPKWPAHPYGWPGEGGLGRALEKYVDPFLEQHAEYIRELGPTTDEHIRKFRKIFVANSNKQLRGYFADEDKFPAYYIPILLGILRYRGVLQDLKNNPDPEPPVIQPVVEPELDALWTPEAMWRSLGEKFLARYAKQYKPQARADTMGVLGVVVGSEVFAMDREEAGGGKAIREAGDGNVGEADGGGRSGDLAGPSGTQGNRVGGRLSAGQPSGTNEPSASSTDRRESVSSVDGSEPSSHGGNRAGKARGKK